MASTVDEKTGYQIRTSDQERPQSGGPGKAKQDPRQPNDSQEHRQGENLFEGIHPCPRLWKEGEESWKKREKKHGQGKAKGNLTRITAPDGLITDFTFDANGNCTGESDSAGRVITRTFDSSNRLTAETRQGAGTMRFIFDATNKG